MRLKDMDLSSSLKSHLFYIPLKIKFLDSEGKNFDEKIVTYVRENKSNRDLHNRKSKKPIDAGIILGSGLGGLVNEIEIELTIPYSEIPDFPVSTVEGHSGKLIIGQLAGKTVLAMQGRFHYYEGYSMKEVTFPVRVMKQIGINTLFVSNASGGLNPDYKVGDVVIISDHINFFPEHPLRGKNMEELGPRFPI